MNREEIRREIDDVDELLVDLFARRMRAVRDMAAYKKERGLPVYDAAREAEKLRAVEQLAPAELRGAVRTLYETLFAIARDYQETMIRREA